MPLDAACLTGIVQECRPAVEGARVDKIFQPARDEIVLLLGLCVVFLLHVVQRHKELFSAPYLP